MQDWRANTSERAKILINFDTFIATSLDKSGARASELLDNLVLYYLVLYARGVYLLCRLVVRIVL